jgi:tetratricopeptide (TPR) repeat protein
MKLLKSILLSILILGFFGCASLQNKDGENFSGSPYFEEPPDKILFSDKELYTQALNLQYKGQLQSAIQLWQKFLAERSQSFEALNNLGMAYYSNDQLDSSIESFESALAIQPDNARIKSNLSRTLRFRVTLERENREYAKAVMDLQKIIPLSGKDQQEKVLREIESVQEKIFEEAQKLNTTEAYEQFIKSYPDSVYASKAKDMLKLLNPTAELAKEPAKEFLPPITEAKKEVETQFEEAAPLVEEKLMESSSMMESKTPEMKMENPAMMDTKISEPKMGEPPMMDTKMEDPGMMDTKMSDMDMGTDGMAIDIPESELMVDKNDPVMDMGSSSKVRQVKIMTKRTPLNIRAKPSARARVIGKVKKGAVVRLIEETSEWYHIAYATGKTGWISRKYSKEVK